MAFSLPKHCTYIIAEIGPNHDGKMEKAYQLIDKATEAGVDAVKFQLFILDEIVSEQTPLAEYQRHSGKENQHEMLKHLLLSHDDIHDLKDYAERKGLDFLTTPFDVVSARFLADLDVKAMKIPSGEITNLPFLKQVATLKIFSIISTGMSSLEEIKEAIAPFKKQNTPYALLHCVSAYPAPVDQINLKAMKTLEEEFNVPVGYSDHTDGIAVPIAAAALGARIIEKHFTINKNDPGPDHAASLEPDELKDMVQSIRIIEQALGTNEKQCQPCEINTRDTARRSIILTKSVKKDEKLTQDMLAIKRPGTGLAPKFLVETIGKRVSKDLSAGTVLTQEYLL
ncbi:MAG: N-acetylneuraminate synthase [Kiritimatiellales bacterium]|nr:N-acetylneuraminate synthase [Kiritimatiellales bacterium]